MAAETQALKKVITIRNVNGLHARPAMAFVDIASRYDSEIRLKKESETVDGKSIMQMLTLAATCGTELELEIVGPDADSAMTDLVNLVESKFGEE